MVFVDGPDPDNLLLALGAYRISSKYDTFDVTIILTGRPVHEMASQDTPTWDWNANQSEEELAQVAYRYYRFLQIAGIRDPYMIHGGIAPRTLVPHHLHLPESAYQGLVDDEQGHPPEVLYPLEDLMKVMSQMPDRSYTVLVGGPMTGLAQLLMPNPQLISKFNAVHAMYGSMGGTNFLRIGDTERNGKQFNVACDPFAGYYVLNALQHAEVPTYLITTEATRVKAFSFADVNELAIHLPITLATEALLLHYDVWGNEVLVPIGEPIYTHDLGPLFSANGYNPDLYHMKPVRIEHVPHLPSEHEDWGKIRFKPVSEGTTTVWATASANAEAGGLYKNLVSRIFTL